MTKNYSNFISRIVTNYFSESSGENIEYHRTNYKIINPKSITMTQLYGLFDPYTHEWTDGVMGGTFREMATATTQERKVMKQ